MAPVAAVSDKAAVFWRVGQSYSQLLVSGLTVALLQDDLTTYHCPGKLLKEPKRFNHSAVHKITGRMLKILKLGQLDKHQNDKTETKPEVC